MSATTKTNEGQGDAVNSREIANVALADTIAWCRDNRGAIGWLCTQVWVDYKLRIQRPQMSRYLAQNPAKRVEPQLGTGLAIMASAHRLKEMAKQNER